MALFAKTPEYFGLDIGSTAIRLVQTKPGSGNANPVLTNYGQIAMPAGLFASDAAADRDKIAQLVVELLKQTKVTTKSVVAGLSSSKIFATVITTPKLDNAQMAKAIKFQAEQYIPMAVDQVKLDFAVLGPSVDGKNLDVLLIAAPNTAVNRYADILDKAGLEPMALEANALAVSRSLVLRQDLAVAILDISSLDSDITIVAGQSPRLMRSVSVGGLTFVRAVAQNLGLDEVQAEQFTTKFGLTQSKLEGQVFKAIKPSLDMLVGEISKSIKFFLSRYPNQKLEKLVLTGSPSSLPELATYLSTELNLPVEFGNPWAGVTYPPNLQEGLTALSSEFAVAVGLAQRGMRK